MRAWIRLFTVWRGAIGQRSFVHGLLVIVVANLALWQLALVAGKPQWIGVMAATLWPTLCLYAKRLRTLGRPPWAQVPQRAVILAALLAPLVGPHAPGWIARSLWIIGPAYLAVVLALLADLVLTAILALDPKAPETVETVFD